MGTHTVREGLKDAVPIALGYISVSFGFGLMAVSMGLSPGVAVLISAANVTSAGQVAGLSVIACGGGCAEMALTQLVINLRYALMSLSISQKLDRERFGLLRRLAAAFCMTDEVFAVASSKPAPVGPGYFLGLEVLSILAWVLGTFLGAVAGGLMPATIAKTLGIAMYGMFVAIVVPVARSHGGVAACALMAAALSCAVYYLPALSFITPGFSVILCSVAAAAAAAWLKPVEGAEA